MIDISWHQLQENSKSKELNFESFCNQIARKKYGSYGRIEEYYNTAGSEFYLELNKDCDEFAIYKGNPAKKIVERNRDLLSLEREFIKKYYDSE